MPRPSQQWARIGPPCQIVAWLGHPPVYQDGIPGCCQNGPSNCVVIPVFGKSPHNCPSQAIVGHGICGPPADLKRKTARSTSSKLAKRVQMGSVSAVHIDGVDVGVGEVNSPVIVVHRDARGRVAQLQERCVAFRRGITNRRLGLQHRRCHSGCNCRVVSTLSNPCRSDANCTPGRRRKQKVPLSSAMPQMGYCGARVRIRLVGGAKP